MGAQIGRGSFGSVWRAARHTARPAEDHQAADQSHTSQSNGHNQGEYAKLSDLSSICLQEKLHEDAK